MTVAYQNAIEGYVSQQLEVGLGYAVCFDNVPFIVPEEDVWIKCEIFDGVVSRASLGSQHVERSLGTVFFTIYSPKSIGSMQAREVVDDIIEEFRSQQFATTNGNLTFYDATVKRLGEVYASGAGSSISATVASTQWYGMVVGISFKHDEFIN